MLRNISKSFRITTAGKVGLEVKKAGKFKIEGLNISL